MDDMLALLRNQIKHALLMNRKTLHRHHRLEFKGASDMCLCTLFLYGLRNDLLIKRMLERFGALNTPKLRTPTKAVFQLLLLPKDFLFRLTRC